MVANWSMAPVSGSAEVVEPGWAARGQCENRLAQQRFRCLSRLWQPDWVSMFGNRGGFPWARQVVAVVAAGSIEVSVAAQVSWGKGAAEPLVVGRVAAVGGPARTLCAAAGRPGRSGTWSGYPGEACVGSCVGVVGDGACGGLGQRLGWVAGQSRVAMSRRGSEPRLVVDQASRVVMSTRWWTAGPAVNVVARTCSLSVGAMFAG